MPSREIFHIYFLLILLLFSISCSCGRKTSNIPLSENIEFNFSSNSDSTDIKYSVKSIVRQLWNNRKEGLNQKVSTALENGRTSVLYNIQDETTLLFEWAIKNEEREIVKDILELYWLVLKYTEERKGINIKIGRIRKPITFDESCRIWVDRSGGALDGTEGLLTNSQFLFSVSRAIQLLSSDTSRRLSSFEENFIRGYADFILKDTYSRWIFSSARSFHVKGWGCDGSYYNHYEFVTKKIPRELNGKSTLSYCNAVTDPDIWIILGAAEMLKAHSLNPDLIPLSSENEEAFLDYLGICFKLLIDRTEIKQENGIAFTNFDVGAWDDHPEHRHKAYESENPPSNNTVYKSRNSSWDIGHARRFVYMYESLNNHKDLVDSEFSFELALEGLANQLYYKVFNGDFNRPLFATYMDGQNGWYRVNYKNRKNFGYGPWKRSDAFIFGGYGRLKKYNPDIEKIQKAIWTNLTSGKLKDRDFVAKYYKEVSVDISNNWQMIQFFTTL